MIDAKLANGELDGYRHHDMPEDPETWRLVAAGLDEAAGGSFAELDADAASQLVSRFAAGELEGGVVGRFPAEGMGGGDARGPRRLLLAPLGLERDRLWRPRLSPRHMRLGIGQREPHQAREVDAEDPVVEVERSGLG